MDVLIHEAQWVMHKCCSISQHINAVERGSDKHTYRSSALWNERGESLDFDHLDLPFSLMRRIAAWQRDFDEVVTPPGTADAAWWTRHRREELDIAWLVQEAIGSRVVVKVHREGAWRPVTDLA